MSWEFTYKVNLIINWTICCCVYTGFIFYSLSLLNVVHVIIFDSDLLRLLAQLEILHITSIIWSITLQMSLS